MITHPDARSHLIAEVLLKLNPKSYGPFGCLFFCADVVKEYAGKDYAAEYRYVTTEKQAMQIYARYGRDITNFITELLGAFPVAPLHAHVGDVLAFKNPDGEVGAGICLGARGVFISADGYRHPEITDCLCAWRIK